MKFRLILFFLFIGILPCLILRFGFLKAYEDRAVSTRSINITSQAKILADQIAGDNYIDKQDNENITVQLNQLSNIYDGRVMVIDKAFRIVQDSYSMDVGKTIISEEVVQSFSGKEISKYDSDSRYLEMTLPITGSGSKDVKGVLLVSVSMDGVISDKEYLGQYALVVELILGVLVFALSLIHI